MESDVWIKSVSDDASISIGDYTFIGRGCELDVSERLSIGSHVLIAPSVFVTDHNHNHALGALISEQGCTSSPVTVHDGAWIGAKAVILPGVTIGRGAVVGAASVVTRDIPDEEIWVGVPARRVGKRTIES